MSCNQLYNQPLTITDRFNIPHTYGVEPNSWPDSYVDTNGNTHNLSCICENVMLYGGWNTSRLVTQAECFSVGGGWSPPSGLSIYDATPEMLGSCGGPLTTPCSGYWTTLNIGDITLISTPYNWTVLGPNPPLWTEYIEVDPCNITNSRPAGGSSANANSGYDGAITITIGDSNYAGPRRSSLRGNFERQCHDFADIVNSAGGCCTRMGYRIDAPYDFEGERINPVLVPDIDPENDDHDIPLTFMPGISPGGWGTGPDGPGGSPGPGWFDRWRNETFERDRERNPGLYNRILSFLAGLGIAVGVTGIIIGISVASGPGVVFGGATVVIITIYNSNGSVTSYTLNIPENGA